MSLNNVLAFALFLKKITRKSSIVVGRKSFQQQQRMKKSATATTLVTTTTVTATMSMKTPATSSCSSSEIIEDVVECNNRSSSVIISTASNILNTPTFVDKEFNIDESLNNSLLSLQVEVKVRDFAYPIDSPLHYGQSDTITKLQNYSAISLSSPEFNGRDARALFDFIPETEYEIALKAGQTVWVQYRQCPGWLIADTQDETGLIPESYVEFI